MNTMNERLRILRKELNLSQAKFGEPIGLSRDEIKNLEYEKTKLKEISIPLICKNYNVSFDWLVTGQGEMFENLPESTLDELCNLYNLDKMDKKILLSYLKLDEEKRFLIKQWIFSIID